MSKSKFAGTVTILAIGAAVFFRTGPHPGFERFCRDVQNLVHHRPLECTNALAKPTPGPLAKASVEFAVAMKEGAEAAKTLDKATENGRQPYLEYEHYTEEMFDRTVTPPRQEGH